MHLMFVIYKSILWDNLFDQKILSILIYLKLILPHLLSIQL